MDMLLCKRNIRFVFINTYVQLIFIDGDHPKSLAVIPEDLLLELDPEPLVRILYDSLPLTDRQMTTLQSHSAGGPKQTTELIECLRRHPSQQKAYDKLLGAVRESGQEEMAKKIEDSRKEVQGESLGVKYA